MEDDRDWLGLFDETLEDGPLPVPRDPELRRQLTEQRFVHGLLRAMHGADAASREARVQGILAGVPDAPAARRAWRRWVAAGIAAAVVLGFGAAVLLPALWPLPRAEAAMRRALERLAAPAHHRWDVSVNVTTPDLERDSTRRFTLTVREGRRFLLEGREPFGPVRIGSDGATLWCRPAVSLLRWSRPFDRECQLGTLLSRNPIAAGDFDMHGLLQALRERGDRLTVDSARGDDGRPRVRVNLLDVVRPFGMNLNSAAIEIDEERGTLERVEVSGVGPGGFHKHLEFEYRGTVELDGDPYARPW